MSRKLKARKRWRQFVSVLELRDWKGKVYFSLWLLLETGQSDSPNSGESHQTPPEGVQEGPGAGGVILKEFQVSTDTLLDWSPSRRSRPGRRMWGPPLQPTTWAGRALCTPAASSSWRRRRERRSYLIESVDEALETGEVSDEFEDPHDSHNPDKPHYLTSLPHDLEILTRAGQCPDRCEGRCLPVAPLSRGPAWRELLRKSQLSSWAAWKISTSSENIWIWQGIPSGKITRLHSLKRMK